MAVRFYSDESSYKGAGRVFVVAGVAIEAYHNVIFRALLKVEEETGKGKRDWHRTKSVRTRQRYLEGALAIPQLRGRVFYQAFDIGASDHWQSTVTTLNEAVRRFCEGKGHCIVAHEGFTSGSRSKLRDAIRREHEDKTVEVIPGRCERDPIIRFADALAGFLRLIRADPERVDTYGNLMPDWLIDVEK